MGKRNGAGKERERNVWEIVNGGEGVERGFNERGRAQSGERK